MMHLLTKERMVVHHLQSLERISDLRDLERVVAALELFMLMFLAQDWSSELRNRNDYNGRK